jgi:hypothetical protein
MKISDSCMCSLNLDDSGESLKDTLDRQREEFLRRSLVKTSKTTTPGVLLEA